MNPVYTLTVYEEDDTTPWFSVSTDPLATYPYLKEPTSYPYQEVDLAGSSASIGQVPVQIVDVPTNPADQSTGFITSKLPDATGYSALIGHRALLQEDVGAGNQVVLDGVIHSVRLLDTFATYEMELRDIRERERKTKAFITTDTPTVMPRGVLNGYGILIPTGPFFGGSVRYPISPVTPLQGIYYSYDANLGAVAFTGGVATRDRRIVTDTIREALNSILPSTTITGAFVFDKIKVLWRASGSVGAYFTLTDLLYSHPTINLASAFAITAGKIPFDEGSDVLRYFRMDNYISAETLPNNGQAIEVIIQYDGPVTEDWPLHIQDETVGALLKKLYDGDYSDEDPRVTYDQTALLALKTPVLAQIKEPVDDLRDWAEKNAYPIAFAAPTLNAAGAISPITYILPDAEDTLPDLDDTNCMPTGGGWDQNLSDAVNIVRVTYDREYSSITEEGQVIISREIQVEHRVSDSIALLGERVLEVESVLLTAIGSIDGSPIFGDHQTEVGAQVADKITRMATDRFALGGQYFTLLADRTDTDVEALLPGSWTTVSVSWMPDYIAATRGLARLAQVVSRRNVSAAWCQLTLVDAGSSNAPLQQPDLGNIYMDGNGIVYIAFDSIPANTEGRVDYAISETTPGADDWQWLDRVASTATIIKSPPQVPGTRFWIRARSEAVGKRPSAWTTAISIRVPDVPRVLNLVLVIDDDGTPTLYGTPNGGVAGVRLRYALHDEGAILSFPDLVS